MEKINRLTDNIRKEINRLEEKKYWASLDQSICEHDVYDAIQTALRNILEEK